MKRLAVLAILVLLVLLAHTAATAPTAPKSEPPPSWTTDLSAAGFGKITFVQRDVRHTDFRGMWLRQHGTCEMRYVSALTGKTIEGVESSDLAFQRRIQFADGLFACGLSLPGNEELREKTVKDFPFDAVEEWLKKYKESCKTTSFFRLGWKWDPETDTDLACVPDWREVIEAHLSVTPQNTALAL